jgi:hypothetical protein
MIAWFNGGIGILVTYWLGTSYLGLTREQLTKSIAVSLVSGFVTLMTTLKFEKIPWVRQNIINRPIKTWVLFVGFYLILIWSADPVVRVPVNFAVLIAPLILSTGITIALFGPIQDHLVAKSQKRRHLVNKRV